MLIWINCAIFADLLPAQNQPSPLALPSCAKLRTRLDQRSVYAINNSTLRNVVDDSKKIFGVQVVLDRRIDADRRFDFKEPDQSLEVTLTHLASQFQAELAWIENIVLVCPRGKGAAIEAAYWRLFQQFGASKKKESSFAWKRLDTPSSIVQRWVVEHGFQSDDVNAIEHDLWDAGSLADCSLAAQLTILLAGFDLTVDFDKESNHLAWKAIPEDVVVQAKYSPVKLPPQAIEDWKKRWPNTKSQFGKGSWSIVAPVPAHRELILPSKGTEKKVDNGKDPFDKQVFSLKLKARLIDILEKLRMDYQFEVQPWPLPRELAEATAQIDVKSVTIDEMLAAIGNSVGATIKRDRLRIIVEGR